MKIKRKNIIFGLTLLSVFGLTQIFNSIETGEQLGIISIAPNVPKEVEKNDHIFSENVKFESNSSNTDSYTYKEIKLENDEKEKIINKDLNVDSKEHKKEDFIVEDWWMNTNNDVGLGNKSVVTDEIFKVELPETIINNKTYTTESITFKSLTFNESNGHFKFQSSEGWGDKDYWHKTDNIYNTSANTDNSLNGEEIDGLVIDTPTTSDDDYQTIYTFKSSFFHPNNSNIKNSSVMVSWNQKQNYMLVKLTNSAILKDMGATDKEAYNFTTSVNIDYSVKMVADSSHYSLENDVFTEENSIDYHDKTQVNINNFSVISSGNGKGNENDSSFFFNSENTYQDVADFLISQKIIASRDEIPWDDVKITFYKDEGQTEKIPMSQHLDGSKIYFSLSTVGGIKDGIHIDASSTSIDDNLNFTIPYKDEPIPPTPEPEETPTINSFEIKNKDEEQITFSFQIDNPNDNIKNISIYDNLKKEDIHQLSKEEIASGEVTINFDSREGEQNWSLDVFWKSSTGVEGKIESEEQTFTIDNKHDDDKHNDKTNIIIWAVLIVILLLIIILGILIFSKKRKAKEIS